MNTHNPNANLNGNTNNSIVGVNQLNQVFSLPKPYQPNQVEDNFHRNNNNSTQPTSLSEANTLTDLFASDPMAVKNGESKDTEDNHNSNKKGKKTKSLTTKPENPKTEALDLEQVTLSFSISPKQKKQIEAIAILSGHYNVDEFIAKLVSQAIQPYLDAVSQALNQDKDKS